MDAGQLPDVTSASEAREVSTSGAGSKPGPGRADQARLVFSSFLMLFVELALIRWITANNVYVTEATNFVLLASYLGIGIGAPASSGETCGWRQAAHGGNCSSPVGSTWATWFMAWRSQASSAYICRRARLELPSGLCSARLCHGL
jgi:hypothetical protein